MKILIVEDHALFAESLELALSIEGYDVRRLPLPEDAASPGTAVAAILRQQPFIVLLDLDLGRFGDGVRLIAPLAKTAISVVVVTGSTDQARWGEAVRQGARVVLSKSRPLNDVLATVRRINDGLLVMEVEERESLLRLWSLRRTELYEMRGKLLRLTAREAQVLGHLMEGHTVHDISKLNVVSEATVRTQVKSILAKLDVSSQLAAVGMAHHVGWRAPSP